ncbi:MAG: peptidylprolyl isomerase [Sulfurimonas sp.]|nr:peptidylprolyl isomerase [Sulfurimonas sp.]
MYKFLLSIVCVASLSAQMIGGVAIVVKDKAITLKDIQKEMSSSNVSRERATNALIRQKLEKVEVTERKITVTSGEVYDDIKATAKRNNMSVNDFYEAALNARGLSSREVKEKTKNKLLAKKLYSAIAYSKVKQPSDETLKEYYELNKATFVHPAAFTTIIYQTQNKTALQEKINSPMFYSPSIVTNEQVLPYDRISPELAKLLTRTKVNTFSPIIPDGKGGHMSFYVKDVQTAEEVGFEKMKGQIQNTLMTELREKVLSEYFARLRHNADITVLREN